MPIAYSDRYKSDFLSEDVLNGFWSRVIITDNCWGVEGEFNSWIWVFSFS